MVNVEELEGRYKDTSSRFKRCRTIKELFKQLSVE